MWRSLTLDQTWQVTRITFKYCIAYAWMLFCRFSSNHPFIVYFLKKNYSLRQNILKILRVWERSLTSVPIGVYLDHIEVGTWLGIDSTKDFEDLLEKSDRTLHRTLKSSVRSVYRRWTVAAKEWPDAGTVFSLCLVRRWSCVRSSEEDKVRINRTLAMSGKLWSDTSSHGSRRFGPLWSQPDSGWQRPVIATGASSQ